MSYKQWAIWQNILRQRERKRKIWQFGGEDDGGWSDYQSEETERDAWQEDR